MSFLGDGFVWRDWKDVEHCVPNDHFDPIRPYGSNPPQDFNLNAVVSQSGSAVRFPLDKKPTCQVFAISDKKSYFQRMVKFVTRIAQPP